MAVTLEQALNDLGNLAEIYDSSLLDYNDQLERVQRTGRETRDDELAVGSAVALVLDGYSAIAGQFDSGLAEILREFQATIGTSATNIDTLLNRLEEYQKANSLSVKSLGVQYDSDEESFTGAGSPDTMLYVNPRTAGDYINEAVTIETLTFEVIDQAKTSRALGQEQYRVSGEGRGVGGRANRGGPPPCAGRVSGRGRPRG